MKSTVWIAIAVVIVAVSVWIAVRFVDAQRLSWFTPEVVSDETLQTTPVIVRSSQEENSTQRGRSTEENNRSLLLAVERAARMHDSNHSLATSRRQITEHRTITTKRNDLQEDNHTHNEENRTLRIRLLRRHPEYFIGAYAKNETLQEALDRVGAQRGDPILIRVYKAERQLEIWIRPDGEKQFEHLRDYRLCADPGPLGPEIDQTDHRLTEGYYRIDLNGLYYDSRYDRALLIGYPNVHDHQLSWVGYAQMIHSGCIDRDGASLSREAMGEVYDLSEAAINAGERSIPVYLYPFEPKATMLTHYTNSRWYGFWENLAQGYRLFNQERRPLRVGLEDGNYTYSVADQP
ncbi:hypothetical protein [Nitratifractor sp.]